MLECRDGRLYTGITTDIDRRMNEHNTGCRGARFTRANPPSRLIGVRQVIDRSTALKLEATLKKLSRAQKHDWAVQNLV